MEVLETFVRSKTGDHQHCEDVIAVTDHFVAVFDGASDVDRRTYDGVSGGRLAAETAARAVSGLPADADMDQAVRQLSEALAARNALGEDLPLQPGVDRPATTLLVYSPYRRELWRIGDSGFAIDGAVSLPDKPVDELAYGLRAAYTTALLAGGAEAAELTVEDPGFELLKPFYRAQRNLVNRVVPYGYGALDGSDVPAGFVECIDVPREAEELVLVTDGYPFIRESLEQTEADLAALIERDPLGIREWVRPAAVGPALEAFDDRAWVRVALT